MHLSPRLPHPDGHGLPVTMPSPLGWTWTSCHHAFPTLIDVDFLSPRPPQSDGRGLPVTMSSPLWLMWTSGHHVLPTLIDMDFLSPRLFHSGGHGLPALLPPPHWGTGAFPLSAPFAGYFATVTRNWLMFSLYLKHRGFGVNDGVTRECSFYMRFLILSQSVEMHSINRTN